MINNSISVEQLYKKLESVESLLTEGLQSNSNNSSDLMDVNECASFLKTTPQAIYSLKSKGKIPFIKGSKRLYFSRRAIEEYLDHFKNDSQDKIAEKHEELLIANFKKNQ